MRTPREQEIARQKKLNARRLKQAEIEEKRLTEEEQRIHDYHMQLLHKIDSKEKPPKDYKTAGRIVIGLFVLCVLSFIGLENPQALLLLIIGILAIAIYFLPTIIAHEKSKKQENAIAVFNIFLGWTFFGWVVALVWACMDD